jgi:hypothetical protein
MVRVSTMLAALGCLLPHSSFVFGSPIDTPAVQPARANNGLPEGYKLTPIN